MSYNRLSVFLILLVLLCLAAPAQASEPCQYDIHCATEAATPPLVPPNVGGVGGPTASSGPQPNGAHMPAAYVDWYLLDRRTFLYDEPWGKRVQTAFPQFTWYGVQAQREVDGETWYQMTSGRWVHGDDVTKWEPSRLKAYQPKGGEPGGLGFVIDYDTPVYAGSAASARRVDYMARYTPVRLLTRSGGRWQIGTDQWLPADSVREVKPVARPDGVDPDAKWIDVNLAQQTVAAYEGDKLVFATLTSTGKEPTPTIQGLFYVYHKKIGEFMAGGWADKDPYVLEEVPWTMYFTQFYAIHGAYWHDQYGEVRSHGCVNLTPDDSKWLFTWSGPTIPPGELQVRASPTNLGTWVYVHE